MKPFNFVLTKSVYHIIGTLSETQQSAKQNHNESEQLKSKCCTSSVMLDLFTFEMSLFFNLLLVLCIKFILYAGFSMKKCMQKLKS